MLGLGVALTAQLVTLSVADRTTTYARSFDGVARLDVDTRPSLALTRTGRRSEFGLRYEPTLGIYQLESARQPLLFHSLSLHLGYRYKSAFLGFDTLTGIGLANFRFFREVTPAPSTDSEKIPRPDPGAPLTPVDQNIFYLTTTETLTYSVRLGARLDATTAAGYFVNSGVDEIARRTFPLQHGPFARFGLGYRLGLRDSLWTLLEGRAAVTDSVRETGTIALSERWTHALSRIVRSEVGAGAALAIEHSPAQATGVTPWPTALALLEYQRPYFFGTVTLTASVRLQPFIDPLTGLSDERATGSLRFAHSNGAFNWFAMLDGAQSVGERRIASLRSITTSLGVGYDFSRAWALALGGNYGLVRIGLIDTSSELYGAFLSLTYRPDAVSLH